MEIATGWKMELMSDALTRCATNSREINTRISEINPVFEPNSASATGNNEETESKTTPKAAPKVFPNARHCDLR
jgi:hypothetical protein